MVKMTEDAAHLTRSLTRRGSAAHGGGLRIVLNPATDSLSMGVASAPERADVVVCRSGARLFLSRPAAARLHGRMLCAEISGSRSVFFLEP